MDIILHDSPYIMRLDVSQGLGMMVNVVHQQYQSFSLVKYVWPLLSLTSVPEGVRMDELTKGSA